MINFLISSFIIIIGILRSGIPSLDVPINVSIPKNLTVEKDTKEISFIGYNPEETFMGYNIYISRESKNEIFQALGNHFKSEEDQKKVEENYIIKNKYLGYPTIQISELDQNVLKEPTLVKYKLREGPSSYKRLIPPYYIGVTAFTNYKNTESDMSEIIYIKE